MEFGRLAASGAVWFLLHAGVAGSPLRFWLVARLGEQRYRSGYSVASVASLLWLIYEYRHARYLPLWIVPRELSYVPLVVVPLAFVLMVGAFLVPSPTGVGGERLLEEPKEPRGVLRITRHPFLWSTVAWAAAHLVAHGDAGSWIFFSSIGLTSLRGAFDIDRKRRRTNAAGFAALEAQTSNVPLAAIFAGRSRLVLRELWLPALMGLALALATIALHSRVFGASAVPALHGF